MKIAILASGLCRNQLDTVIRFDKIEKLLLKYNIDFDVFYYTNDVIGNHIPYTNREIDKEKKHKTFDILQSKINFKTFTVEKYENFYHENEKFIQKVKKDFKFYTVVENTFSQWSKVYNNFLKLEDHVLKSNSKYDFIFNCRADFSNIPYFNIDQLYKNDSDILILTAWFSGLHSSPTTFDYSSINLIKLWKNVEIYPIDTFQIVKYDTKQFFYFYNFIQNINCDFINSLNGTDHLPFQLVFNPEILLGIYIKYLKIKVDFIKWSNDIDDIPFIERENFKTVKNIGTPFCPEISKLFIAEYI